MKILSLKKYVAIVTNYVKVNVVIMKSFHLEIRLTISFYLQKHWLFFQSPLYSHYQWHTWEWIHLSSNYTIPAFNHNVVKKWLWWKPIFLIQILVPSWRLFIEYHFTIIANCRLYWNFDDACYRHKNYAMGTFRYMLQSWTII